MNLFDYYIIMALITLFLSVLALSRATNAEFEILKDKVNYATALALVLSAAWPFYWYIVIDATILTIKTRRKK